MEIRAVKIWCESCRQTVMITDADTGKENRLNSEGGWVECATETIYLSCGHYIEFKGDPDQGGEL